MQSPIHKARFAAFKQQYEDREWDAIEYMLKGVGIDEASKLTGVQPDRLVAVSGAFCISLWNGECRDMREILMTGIFRVEHPVSVAAIARSGFIRCSTINAERRHYAARTNSVALFDLPWAGPARSSQQMDRIAQVVTGRCVFLGLSSKYDDLLDRFTPELEEDIQSGKLVEFVESWSREPVPWVDVTRCFLRVQSVLDDRVVKRMVDLSELVSEPERLLDRIQQVLDSATVEVEAHDRRVLANPAGYHETEFKGAAWRYKPTEEETESRSQRLKQIAHENFPPPPE